MEIKITHIEDIDAAAREFITAVGDRRIIAFYGTMGAGKTTFIRALCSALGVRSQVTSPTFAIVNEYEIAGDDGTHSSLHSSVFHFDFYRIRRLEEAMDIGFEDYLCSGHWCLIEWPELVEPLLPEETLCVHLTVGPDDSRLLSF